MKNLGKLALLGAALAVSASSAFATSIVYTTSGTFAGGTGVINNSASLTTATDTFGTGPNQTIVTFTDASQNLLSPSNASFGLIQYTTTGTGATSGTANFDLNILQSAPSGGTGDFLGTLTGTVFLSNSSDSKVVFSNLFLIVGSGPNTVTYDLANGGVFNIATPGNIPPFTSIQGTATAAPEPNSLMLLGTGLFSGAGMLMRRRKIA